MIFSTKLLAANPKDPQDPKDPPKKRSLFRAARSQWRRASASANGLRATLGLAICLLIAPRIISAQAPNLDWRTIRTPHFYVHFNPNTEGFARRVAADAERAYSQLSQQLHPPRGMIDIVISDDVDASNGSATPFPTNRIVVFANPPVTESALRYTNDWGQMVISHELTHIFHLDRTRGVWSLGQHIFGRAAALFPNSYSPSWLTEGLAVYEESKIAGAGRIEGSEHRMIARSAAIDHTFPRIGSLSLAQGRFPFGEEAYGYGSLFVDYVARRYGEAKVRQFVDKSAADIIPYLYDVPSKQAFGVTFSRAYRDFRDSVQRSVPSYADPISGWKQLTRDGNYVLSPRWLTDSSIVYSGTPGRETFGAYRIDINGKRTRIGRRNSRSPNIPIGPNRFLFAQSDYVNPYQVRSDLWIADRGHEHQLTFGKRLVTPDVRTDGEIVAEQIVPGATRLVLVSRDGKSIRPITTGSYDEQWTEPRWSHRGDKIAAVRWLRGNLSQIVILDSLGKEITILASGQSIQATPSWSYDDAGVYYSSDHTGEAQVYFARLDRTTYRVSSAGTGIFEPQASPRDDRLAAVLFKSDGYHLGVSPCCDANAWRAEPAQMVTQATNVAPVLIDSSPAKKYSPWRTFVPRYWLPTIDPGIRDGYRIGALTSGSDVIGRHTMEASLRAPTNGLGGLTGSINYQYSGFGLPIIQLDAAQDWESLGFAFERDASRTPIGEVFRRTWSGDATATWLRTRARKQIALTGGVGIEHRTHVLDGSDLPLTSLDTTGGLGSPTFPSIVAAASFANAQRPPYSISPEDGVSLNVTVRDRFNSGANGNGDASYSTVGQAAIYKSLNLPGFAHHVLALRGSAGYSDENASGYFLVGGVSGSSYEIIPGYTLGEGRKTFPVRGFAAGTVAGTRAVTGSAEYRVPLFLLGGAPGPLPFFFDRSSLTFFGDYGVAWCPDIKAGREVCNQPRPVFTDKLALASVGAELNLTLGLLSWDTPYRFRVGLVSPTSNQNTFGRQTLQVYFIGGISF